MEKDFSGRIHDDKLARPDKRNIVLHNLHSSIANNKTHENNDLKIRRSIDSLSGSINLVRDQKNENTSSIWNSYWIILLCGLKNCEKFNLELVTVQHVSAPIVVIKTSTQ